MFEFSAKSGGGIFGLLHGDLLVFNPLNAELNPIYHLLVLLRDHHILHISRIRVKGPF